MILTGKKFMNLTVNRNMTIQLLQIIGSPFTSPINLAYFPDNHIRQLFKLAFQNRVELLFLDALNRLKKIRGLEQEYIKLKNRYAMTLSVIAKACYHLGASNIPYVVFKSIKPYPATPNDTDILCLGNAEDYKKGMDAFFEAGYKEHGVAPLQTNIYDPRGEGKIGPGKKGGIYYIDFYQDVATDYFVYINKKRLVPFVRDHEVNAVSTNVLAPEPELGIVLFHNVIPEKTFHLEHFYLPLYRFSDPSFNIETFCQFVENNQLVVPVRANLSLIEALHKKAFAMVPRPILMLLNRWGREKSETDRLIQGKISVPYYFTKSIFCKAFLFKLRDPNSVKSIFNQGFHMLNPKFAADALRSFSRRILGHEKYVHE